MALHEFLQGAVKESIAETLGTVVGEDGELATPPKVAEFYAGYQQMQAVVSTLQEQVVGYGATIAQQASQIDQLTSLLGNKANASTVSTLSQRVTTLGTTVDSKASTAYVDQQVHAIGDVDASQAAAISQMKQELTGDGSQLTTLLSNQASQKLLLDALRTDVDLKAPGTTVSTLSGRVTSLANTVNDASTGLATKASAADLAPVASAVNNTLTGLGAAYALAGAAKAAADLSTTVAGSAKTSADTATTVAAAATANANTRLLRTGDTSTGNQKVPNPSTANDAVPLGWLAGGVGQPFRFFANTGATPVATDDITNPFPSGTYVLWIDRIGLVLSTAPTVSTTLTVTATVGGTTTTIFTKTMALATLAPVNSLLDVLTLSSTPLPAITGLPVTLKASLSGGAVGTIILSGKLQKTA